jgi:hypothetical protein
VNRLLGYGSVLTGIVVMFFPVSTHLLGIPVSCGTGWQAVTATGDAGAVCNSAGQSRGLIALVVVLVGLVLAYSSGRGRREEQFREDFARSLPPEQRAAYDAAVMARMERPGQRARRRFAVLGVLVLVLFALVVLGVH